MHPHPAAPRLPKNYRLVNDVVREHGDGRHLSTSDVHALARKRHPAIGFTTVYRALSRLTQLGLVSEVRVPGAGMTYFESPAEPHAHFHCESCGRIDDLPYRMPGAVLARIARAHDLTVSDALVTVVGRCSACRTAEPAASQPG